VKKARCEPVRTTHGVQQRSFGNATSKPAPSPAARVRHPENLEALNRLVSKGVRPASRDSASKCAAFKNRRVRHS
jgi:hypothetical protein